MSRHKKIIGKCTVDFLKGNIQLIYLGHIKIFNIFFFSFQTCRCIWVVFKYHTHCLFFSFETCRSIWVVFKYHTHFFHFKPADLLSCIQISYTLLFFSFQTCRSIWVVFKYHSCFCSISNLQKASLKMIDTILSEQIEHYKLELKLFDIILMITKIQPKLDKQANSMIQNETFDLQPPVSFCLTSFTAQLEGILPKGPYLPCVSIAGRALLAGYHRITWNTSRPRQKDRQFAYDIFKYIS